jgi:hypothetical protein
VLVMADSKTVRIYADLRELTNHQRTTHPWQVRSRPEHAPAHVQQYLNHSTEGLSRWAQRLGPNVAMVAAAILSDKAVDGMRPVRGLLHLATPYTASRLEAACARALQFGTPTYRSVKDILTHHLEQLPSDQPSDSSIGQLHFRFVREYGYFDPQRHKEVM